MSDPTTHNQGLEIVDEIISALMKGGVVAAEAYIAALAPEMMAIPIVAWIIDQGIEYLASVLSVVEKKIINNIVIDIQVNGEKSAVITQATALQFAISSGDKNAIDKQANEAAAAWGALIHFDGISDPLK